MEKNIFSHTYLCVCSLLHSSSSLACSHASLSLSLSWLFIRQPCKAVLNLKMKGRLEVPTSELFHIPRTFSEHICVCILFSHPEFLLHGSNIPFVRGSHIEDDMVISSRRPKSASPWTMKYQFYPFPLLLIGSIAFHGARHSISTKKCDLAFVSTIHSSIISSVRSSCIFFQFSVFSALFA